MKPLKREDNFLPKTIGPADKKKKHYKTYLPRVM